MSELIIDKVSAFATELLPSMGLELVEVQFRREQHGWVLRVFIDSEGGINLDHCSLVSREVGDYLDVEDLIDHPYHLEVSSPGLERKLTKIEDFQRFRGKKAKVKLHQALENQKTFIGVLDEVSEDEIVMTLNDEKQVKFSLDMISSARLAL